MIHFFSSSVTTHSRNEFFLWLHVNNDRQISKRWKFWFFVNLRWIYFFKFFFFLNLSCRSQRFRNSLRKNFKNYWKISKCFFYFRRFMIVTKDVREIFLGIIYSGEGRFSFLKRLSDCSLVSSSFFSSAKLMSCAASAILSLDLNSAKNIVMLVSWKKLGNKSKINRRTKTRWHIRLCLSCSNKDWP